MLNLTKQLEGYMDFCKYQKNLDEKTLKAYGIDLRQFTEYVQPSNYELSRAILTNFITELHKKYKPKSAKRKIASVKAFFAFLEYEEIISESPFTKIKIKFKEPYLLPRTIPLKTIEMIFGIAYRETHELEKNSNCQFVAGLRDIAVLELLFATGVRVSELCNLRVADIDLEQGNIKIYGKGAKERMVQIANTQVLQALKIYYKAFQADIDTSGFFFVNRLHRRLSEQSVRFMINKYVSKCNLSGHVTPHMFRHPYVKPTLKNNLINFYEQASAHLHCPVMGRSLSTSTQSPASCRDRRSPF